MCTPWLYKGRTGMDLPRVCWRRRGNLDVTSTACRKRGNGGRQSFLLQGRVFCSGQEETEGRKGLHGVELAGKESICRTSVYTHRLSDDGGNPGYAELESGRTRLPAEVLKPTTMSLSGTFIIYLSMCGEREKSPNSGKMRPSKSSVRSRIALTATTTEGIRLLPTPAKYC